MKKTHIMLALSDVNVLLALALPVHQHHGVAAKWLGTRPEASVAVCRVSQNGFLRLLTQRGMLGAYGRTMEEAWEIYDRLMSDSRFLCLREPDGTEDLWRRLCPLNISAPHLWTDAYLAAFAAAGRMQIVTFDRGFRQFAGLDVLVLGQQPELHEEKSLYQAGY